MTVTLTAALILTIAGFLVLLDRKDARGKQERDADRKERQTLLQRIQAPEAAVVDHSMRLVPDDPNPYPLSDEELAEQEERARVLQFIERHENGAS
jgi:hypothetical protein